MTPKINGIDHIHIQVSDRAKAQRWYRDVLGYEPVEGLLSWAGKTGPLTLENPDGNAHLALFEREQPGKTTAIAFGTDGEAFLAWRSHLESHGLELRVADHELAYSLYFSDPDGNLHEITTYEHDYVKERIGT